MKAVIIAGGKGVRLRPITYTLPKPMIRINNKPLVEYTVNLLKKYGFTDITFTLHYLPHIIIDYFEAVKSNNLKISYVIEPKPKGTAGGLMLLKETLTDTFIVCASDCLYSCDLKKLISFHKEKKGIATICIYKNQNPNPKSEIKINSEQKVIQFTERPEITDTLNVWSNTGLYILEPEIFQYIVKDNSSDFGNDVFPKIVLSGAPIFAYDQMNYFLDVGTKEKFSEAAKVIERLQL